MKTILSRDNPFFKSLKKLCQNSRERQKQGKIILDGLHLIETYLAHAGLPELIVLSERGAIQPEHLKLIQSLGNKYPLVALSDTLFAELATVDAPSGILALTPYPVNGDSVSYEVDTLILDGIQDPGNLGSILRTAAAAGVKQVILSEDCAQVWSPKTLRAGMGAHFLLSIHEKQNLENFISQFSGDVILTTPDTSLTLYDMCLERSLAWVLGSEGQGISQNILNLFDKNIRRIKIPMPGNTESLNVGAAAAVCLFEMVRQRQQTR